MEAAIMDQQERAEKIARTEDNLKKRGQCKITFGLIEATLTRLEKKWEEFEATHHAVKKNATRDELKLSYFEDDVFSQTEDEYIFQKGMLLDRMRAFTQGAPAQEAREETGNKQPLPRINLPQFSGVCTEWMNFRDLFSSMVIDNVSLSNIQRMHYLKMSMQQEPATLISSLPNHSENFPVAWQILIDKYENTRLLTISQIAKIVELTPVKSESSTELNRLYSNTICALGALKTLGRPINTCDDFTVYLTVQKLDRQSRREWEACVGARKDPPPFKDLQKFLEKRIGMLEALECTNPHPPLTSSKVSSRTIKSFHSSAAPTPLRCALCKQDHYILFCENFRAKTANDRKACVMTNNLCLNCLGHHRVRECRSQKTCQVCKGKHHTLLHDARGNSVSSAQNVEVISPPVAAPDDRVRTRNPNSTFTAHTAQSTDSEKVLLATALVNAHSTCGDLSIVRALLDQGSEASFVTESLVQRLRLPRSSASVIITGIVSDSCTTPKGRVTLLLSSRVNAKFKISVDAYVLPRVTTYQPPGDLSVSQWPHLKGLPLADPKFSDPTPIELLLGANVYSRLLLDRVQHGLTHTPTAQNSQLGWILSGHVGPPSGSTSQRVALHITIDRSLSSDLQRFWEQEEIPAPSGPLRSEDRECEDHFVNTHSRNTDGRYIVRLPLRKPLVSLGDSFPAAKYMLHRMERRFTHDAQFGKDYSAFMTEYENLGHMEIVPSAERKPPHVFYLPHHGVIKETSSTTRLRVVFNGSQRTDSGASLNDLLHVGPKLVPDLVDILLRWRTHAVVFSADMEKMYRQVLLHHEDCDLQRILWRKPSSDSTAAYRLRTVTYGLASAPFLAIRVIRQLADDEKHRFPIGAAALLTDVYVDDVLSGADDTSSALTKQQQLIELLKAGGFALRKWTSNTPAVLSHLPSQSIGGTSAIAWQPETASNVLGLTWQSSADNFMFHVKNAALQPPITKRRVLSRIAQLFDPLGWLAPVTVVAKIFMQSLWLHKLGWDDPLPEPDLSRWIKFYIDLSRISEVRIPRWLHLRTLPQSRDIHGFADASERAYAAVIYLRVITNGNCTVSLVIAKTKVAPVKQVSLPRLELCAAHLVTKLAKYVRDVLALDCPVHLWSDSTVTLAWIRDHPTRWKTYVANRVSEIQCALPDAQWHHVRSEQNPADCASRGLHASEFINHNLWWAGPSWLQQSEQEWPTTVPRQPGVLPDQKILCHATSATEEEKSDLMTRYSDITKLSRITAWCLRFIRNTQHQREGKERHVSPILLPSELKDAIRLLIGLEQQRYFRSEIATLNARLQLSKGSLVRLHPYLDKDGYLRVGGRLKHALLNPDEKHPVILPKGSPLTTLIIERGHQQTLHGGTQLTLSTLRQNYWIPGGRLAVKAVLRRCMKCTRLKAEASTQLMGNLPANRVTPSRPFLHAGVDYAGPIHLRTTKGRGYKSYKAYIAVFVCFSSRAVHLEAVSDYSTEAFLAAYKRFTARRGNCATITSDCGTNFIGADAELRSMFSDASSQAQRIASLLANDGTLWKFNPPAAPHFGGLWEAAVKSIKYHLRRVIGETTLTFEEMSTLLAQVEACLNSRPLQPISDDPDDLSALTPAHFLIGGPLTAVPEPCLRELPSSRLSRWQLIQQMRNGFWDRIFTLFTDSSQMATSATTTSC